MNFAGDTDSDILNKDVAD